MSRGQKKGGEKGKGKIGKDKKKNGITLDVRPPGRVPLSDKGNPIFRNNICVGDRPSVPPPGPVCPFSII